MIATSVGFAFHPNRKCLWRSCRTRLAFAMVPVAAFVLAPILFSQAAPPEPAVTTPPAAGNSSSRDPIALVPLDNNNQASAAKVTGAIEVSAGKAVIATSGTITSGTKTTEVILPRRGVLRVCASTSVHLSADASVPAGEAPGLMMALDHGAIETSFATGNNSDILLTPDFRILIGGPGSADVKVRLGQHGDTCVDNPGSNAPYVVVSSVFEGGAYRVQPGQRVMFQHGSLNEVVDQEKEPCGCPPDTHAGTNDFPLAQSAGLAPLEKPAPAPQPDAASSPKPQPQSLNEPLVYSARPSEQTPVAAMPPAATSAPAPPAQPSTAAPPVKKKAGFFRSVGRFFRKVFGAD